MANWAQTVPQLQQALKRVAVFDGQMPSDSVAVLILNAWADEITWGHGECGAVLGQQEKRAPQTVQHTLKHIPSGAGCPC